MSIDIIDPSIIHKISDKWYFWDESYFGKFGPFDTESEAFESYKLYCKYLDKQGWDNKQVIKPIDWDFIILVAILASLLSIIIYSLTW